MWSRACFACNCYPKIFRWFLLFNGSIDVPQQTTSKYANQHLKFLNAKEGTRENITSSSFCLSFRLQDVCFQSKFTFFWGGWWIISWDLFFKQKTHTQTHKIHSKELPQHFSQTKRLSRFSQHLVVFPLGRFGVAKVQSTPRILRLRTRCWATLPSCSPGEKKGDYGNYKCKGCEKQTVNIEKKYIPAFCMYVYIYIDWM